MSLDSRLEYVGSGTSKDIREASCEQMNIVKYHKIVKFELNRELIIITLLLKDPSHVDAVNLRPVQNPLRHHPEHVAQGVKPSE